MKIKTILLIAFTFTQHLLNRFTMASLRMDSKMRVGSS